MIELILSDRCSGCGDCIAACPSNVFEADASGKAAIARPQDCQTCFLCELHCRADAIFVGANCETFGLVTEEQARAGGTLGQYRRTSGWHEFEGDPAYADEHWRMEHVFALARDLSLARNASK